MSSRKREKSPEQHLAFLRTMIRNYVKRVADDRNTLEGLIGLQAELDQAIEGAVEVVLAEPHCYSWAQVGDALGISRQAAWKRFHHLPHARQAGGQPAALR